MNKPLYGWLGADAVSLVGTRVSGPHPNPAGTLTVGFFTDPEGHLIGLAAPAAAA